MADGADAHDAVPDLEVAPGIPRNGGDPVAELDAVAIQALRNLQRAIANFGVIGAMNGAFDRSCHDLLRTMEPGGVFDNPVTKQRPILHQTTHTDVPPECYSLSHDPPNGERFGEKIMRLLGNPERARTQNRLPVLPIALSAMGRNFSAAALRRKWPCGGSGRMAAAMVTIAAALLMLCVQSEPAAARHSSPDPWNDLFGTSRGGPPSPSDMSAEPAAAASQPSTCRLALTEAVAIAPSIPDIHGAGGCGGVDLVRLEAVVLPDKRQVSVKPAAILRCTMAWAIADWIRTDIA